MARRPMPHTLTAIIAAAVTTLVLTKRTELLRLLASLLAAAQAADEGRPAELGAKPAVVASVDDQVVLARAQEPKDLPPTSVPTTPSPAPTTPAPALTTSSPASAEPPPAPTIAYVPEAHLFDAASGLAATGRTQSAVTSFTSVTIKATADVMPEDATFYLLDSDHKRVSFKTTADGTLDSEFKISGGNSLDQDLIIPIPPEAIAELWSFQGQVNFVPSGPGSNSAQVLSLKIDRPILAAPKLTFKPDPGKLLDVSKLPFTNATDTSRIAATKGANVTITITGNGDVSDTDFLLFDEHGQPVQFALSAGGALVDRFSLDASTKTGTIVVPIPAEEVAEQHRYRGALTSKVAGRAKSPQSEELTLVIDKVGPKIDSILYDDTRPDQPVLLVRLADTDLKPGSIKKEALLLVRHDPIAGTTTQVQNFTVETDPIRPDLLVLKLAILPQGDYELSTTAAAIAADKRLEDYLGNSAGTNVVEPQSFKFMVLPPGQTGLHVEFPQFTPPKVQGDREQPFNPDDFVETRVSRLYYFRDAHRVAQIINRNVRSYNRAAVTQAQRIAEEARTEANKRVDERRAAEREAVRKADELRHAEENLQAVQDAIADNQARGDEIAQIQNQVGDLAKQIKDVEDKAAAAEGAALKALNDQRNALVLEQQRRQRRLEDLQRVDQRAPRDIGGLRADLQNTQNRIDTLRTEMQQAQETSDVAQAKEDRQVEDAFRKEVAAASEDPDTYVPGKLDSVDPVTQVSISVIGEGLLQLRGPIKGINKIRTMINQIDSPLGQVKVGIFTVQVNGERGERMERVARRIEGNVDLSRFLTSHALMLMRRAVQEVATEIANECFAQLDGHTQVDRDRRYLYAFFGRDFVDSLFAMKSEFLYTGNHLLSLNSMDNISLNRALFVLALARNDVRQRILERFMQHVACELPTAEYDYRIATRLDKPGKHLSKRVHEDACRRYIFRNFRSIFESEQADPDTLNPMQLEFLRLAQIFKSQMVTEVELKQRIVERGLIQDRANDEIEMATVLDTVQGAIREQIQHSLLGFVKQSESYQDALARVGAVLSKAERTAKEAVEFTNAIIAGRFNKMEEVIDNAFNSAKDATEAALMAPFDFTKPSHQERFNSEFNKLPDIQTFVETLPAMDQYVESNHSFLQSMTSLFNNEDARAFVRLSEARGRYRQHRSNLNSNDADTFGALANYIDDSIVLSKKILDKLTNVNGQLTSYIGAVRNLTDGFGQLIGGALRGKRPGLADPLDAAVLDARVKAIDVAFGALKQAILNDYPADGREVVLADLAESRSGVDLGVKAVSDLRRSVEFKRETRQPLDHRKLLDHLIDEMQDKYIELVEGTRSYTANIDAYLKRLVVALEDDCRIQFYDPAFERIRGAAREYDVELGQVERTTILTNNRQFAKVEPTATMEFDLPKRDIVITEAMKGAKALVQDYGALLQDPTFLSATSLLSGSPPTSSFNGPVPPMPGVLGGGIPDPNVRPVLPGLPSNTPQQPFSIMGKPQPELGSNLAALIPDPAIYKFETGTGFEIRPVIQPDGDSIIYDFDYMYTTNVREPVRPDEKHLGRVKRHLVHTQVQTSTYELREISRYTVALKAARTSRGVPLFEDIPGLGILFRPLPSDESSLQQNIILGQSTVYPTLFDLMGLRWAPYVVDLDDERLTEEEFVVRGRRKNVTDWTFDEGALRVDKFLRIEEDYPELFRSDLYRTPDRPSPFHPNGYNAPNPRNDPTNRGYRVPDGRPPEFRVPGFNQMTGRLDREPLDQPIPAERAGGVYQEGVPSESPHGGEGVLNTPTLPAGAGASEPYPFPPQPNSATSPEPGDRAPWPPLETPRYDPALPSSGPGTIDGALAPRRRADVARQPAPAARVRGYADPAVRPTHAEWATPVPTPRGGTMSQNGGTRQSPPTSASSRPLPPASATVGQAAPAGLGAGSTDLKPRQVPSSTTSRPESGRSRPSLLKRLRGAK